ncbi:MULTISPECIES: hypothetical protein [unclassified Pseudonocardia]|uniref:hypothetical protein n=1 Tax=unclassified Pseudonocardia TaxID=2619320 RepID=UPI0001FFDF7A|nr:hypothetical protein [Pseudonocardia sp. Ae707_Ps1]OLM17583.1 hypothetical protein Ae707Ps1_1842c [Pseudonocardia sp. Ae707_Ps1]
MSEPTYILRYDGFALNGENVPAPPVACRRTSSKIKVRGRKNMEATRKMLREAGYTGITVVEKRRWWS